MAANSPLQTCTSPLTSPTKGLCGRILRGRAGSGDFKKFSPEIDRDLVFLMGADGLESLVGKTGYQMLESIGYESDYIAEKVKGGCEFKLVIFSAKSVASAKQATWAGALEVVKTTYPALSKIITAVEDKLKTTSLSQMEACYCQDRTMASIDVCGKEDPMFMTAERLAATPESTPEVMLARVRAFLYHTCQMRQLYAGDGFTHSETGERGMEEWMAPNMSLEDLGESTLVDLFVELPLPHILNRG